MYIRSLILEEAHTSQIACIFSCQFCLLSIIFYPLRSVLHKDTLLQVEGMPPRFWDKETQWGGRFPDISPNPPFGETHGNVGGVSPNPMHPPTENGGS